MLNWLVFESHIAAYKAYMLLEAFPYTEPFPYNVPITRDLTVHENVVTFYTDTNKELPKILTDLAHAIGGKITYSFYTRITPKENVTEVCYCSYLPHPVYNCDLCDLAEKGEIHQRTERPKNLGGQF